MGDRYWRLELDGGEKSFQSLLIFARDSREFHAEAIGSHVAHRTFAFKGEKRVGQSEPQDSSGSVRLFRAKEHAAQADDRHNAL